MNTPRKPVVYISGPMSGYENYNFGEFNRVAYSLRSLGHSVVNPADFGAKENQNWRDCLIRDLNALGHCDVLIQLDGHEASKGACLEAHVAREYGIEIMSYSEFVAEYV